MREIKTVGIVGAGTMGHGIAQVAAQSGFEVTLVDTFEGALEKGVARIHKGLDRMVHGSEQPPYTTGDNEKQRAGQA